jgi:hypothetical protein
MRIRIRFPTRMNSKPAKRLSSLDSAGYFGDWVGYEKANRPRSPIARGMDGDLRSDYR